MSFTKEDCQKIFAEVKANAAKLDACVGPHDFVCNTPERPFGAKYRCTKCDGVTRGDALHWYKAGLKHGAIPVS